MPLHNNTGHDTPDDAQPSRDPLDVSGTSSGASSSLWDKPMDADDPSSAPSIDLARSPLLRRYPTFVPLRRHATSIAEVAFLVPSSTSSRRKATLAAATFNVTATIIGGGVLSIPLSCARAGIVPFTLLMILSAIATDFSLYLLVSCARRCGSTSFGAVARMAYGPALEAFTTGVVFFLVGCTVVGLMILNQGIWSPIVAAGMASLRGQYYEEVEEGGGGSTMLQDAVVLFALLLVMMPFLLKRDLTSLRHICYVGFFSIAVLCVAMCYRAYERNTSRPGLFWSNVKWTATTVPDILSALPIILQAFLCSFNIISVSSSLVQPTRERVRKVIREAVSLSFLLMYVFGLSGYLFAYESTDGNILLNFDPTDKVIFLGRIGCGCTTLFALPMNVLPTREALLSLVAQIGEAEARRGASREERRRLVDDRSAECESTVAQKPRSVSVSESNARTDEENGVDRKKELEYGTVSKEHVTGARGTVTKSGPATKQAGMSEDAIHWTATLGIISVCYVAAVLAPGVAIVWDITGSSMAFLLQFIIPSACYIRLKLRAGRRSSRNLVLAWILLIFAVIMAVLCTTQTALRLSGVISR